MENNLDFVKLVGKWYADVPGWKGNIEDLEMVMGADELLDYLSGNKKFVSLSVSTSDNGGVKCTKNYDIYGGAEYSILDVNSPVKVFWLCEVNNFFWGGMAPDTIWFKVNE